MKIALDIEMTDALKKEGLLRGLVRTVNQLRKDAGLSPRDRIALSYHTEDAALQSVFKDFVSEIKKNVAADELRDAPGGEPHDIDGYAVSLSLQRLG